MHQKMVSKPIRAQPNEQKAYNPKQTPSKNLFELIDFGLIFYSVSTSFSQDFIYFNLILALALSLKARICVKTQEFV